MVRDIFSSIGNYFSAFTYISKCRLWSYFIISGLISVGLLTFIFAFAFNFSTAIGSFFVSFYPWEWGRVLLLKVASFLGGLIILSLGSIIYKYTLLILISPLLSPLSLKLEKQINPYFQESRDGFIVAVSGLKRSLGLTIRNITKELFYTIVLLVCSFFPGIGIFTTVLIFLVQAYYSGFGNMDFMMERYYNINDASFFVKKNKGLAIGNGAVFLLLLAIPFIGAFLAPTLSTIASTIDLCNRIPEYEQMT